MLAVSPYEIAIPTRAGYRDISPEATFAARGKARLIDVREADEINGELGHIPGIEWVPLATLEKRMRTWNHAEEIILVCRSGARSGRGAEAMVNAGFQKVMNMAGGMLAYNAAGLPVARA
jgi:rhodanese-related sulfurtransferase